MIEPLALLVPVRELKSFLAPEARNLFVIDPPAFRAHKRADFAAPVSSVLVGQTDQSKKWIIGVLTV